MKRHNRGMARRQVSTTVTEKAWLVFVGATEHAPYYSQTDVVSAALLAFGRLGKEEKADLIQQVRASKRKGWTGNGTNRKG
ncbi:MAG: hypothetical protein EHM35_21480 [Planctomycetaceae bacterium]|nr:MAG: hypothetical protein EHM35_21480 [Planctomycetaceae bacterium]